MRFLVVKKTNHVENRVSRFCQVRKYEGVCIACLSYPPKKSALHVGTDTHLASLEYKSAYAPGFFELGFELFMNSHLTGV